MNKKAQPFQILSNGITEDSFDLVLRLSKDANTTLLTELFIGENTSLMIEGLIEKYGSFFLKVNWFSKDLMIVVENTDTSVSLPEGRRATIDQKQ